MEINIEMINVLGESAIEKTMICKWVGFFRRDCTSLINDPLKGLPKKCITSENIAKIQVL